MRAPNCIETLAMSGIDAVEKVGRGDEHIPFDALTELPSGRVVSTRVEAITRRGAQACFVTPHGEFYSVCPDDEKHRVLLEKWVPLLNRLFKNPLSANAPDDPPSLQVFVAGESPWVEIERRVEAKRAVKHGALGSEEQFDDLASTIKRAFSTYIREEDFDEPETKSPDVIDEAWARASAAFDIRVEKWDERQQRKVEAAAQLALHFYMNELGEVLRERTEAVNSVGAKSLRPVFGLARRQAMHLKAQSAKLAKMIALYARANYWDVVEALGQSNATRGFSLTHIAGAAETLLKNQETRVKYGKLGATLRAAADANEPLGPVLMRWLGGGEAVLATVLTMMVAYHLQRVVMVSCERDDFEYPQGWPNVLIHEVMRPLYQEKKFWIESFEQIVGPLAESKFSVSEYILSLTANFAESVRLLALSEAMHASAPNAEVLRKKTTGPLGAGFRVSDDGAVATPVAQKSERAVPVHEKPSAELLAVRKDLERVKDELLNVTSELDEAKSLNLALKRALDAELMQEQGERSQSNGLPRVEDLQGVIVGGHENWHAKVRKALPKVRVMHPDASTINTDTFTDADFVAFHTNYCNHRLFEQAYKDAKKRAKRIFFIERNNIGHVLQQIARECGARVEGIQ